MMSPPYATTALIPENCLRIMTWMAVKMAAGGVEGYEIYMPVSPTFGVLFLGILIIGAGNPRAYNFFVVMAYVYIAYFFLPCCRSSIF